ncbi:MAG: hypothetical protein JXR71_04775 [Bacteroidales bacterium]|nr:hypothetical protein [Bacteroidales bacterium]
MKKIYPLIAFLVLLCSLPTAILAQDVTLSNDLYGLSPVLYNGKYYTYSPPVNTKGNQFIVDRHFTEGSVRVKGNLYDSLSLNYDIFNQQLILEFYTVEKNRLLISLSNAWLDSFTLGKKHFKALRVNGEKKEYYQVFGEGPFKILYFWHKNMNFVSSTGSSYYVFSKPYKTTLLLEGNNAKAFKSNSQFIRLFDKKNRAAVAKFLRQHQINIKRASDKEIQELMNFCNTLSR